MKSPFKLFLLSIILLSFSQCVNSKDVGYKLERKAPFKVVNATYQSWVAGVAGGGSGITIRITLEDVDAINAVEYYKIEGIIFRGQTLKPELKQHKFQLIGRYKSMINRQNDQILHSNSIQEYGNTAPVKDKLQNQFNVLDNEVVISYFQKGKLKFFKLKLSKMPSEQYQ